MSCNEINLQEAFFLFSCQKRKKGILHRHHKKLIFQIMPCSFQGCKLLLRWCSPSQSLWVAFIFGTAPGHRAGWPFCCLDCDLWPHPHSPCIISAVSCRLESIERRNFAAFLSFSSTNQENWAVQHIQWSHGYIVNLTHRWSSQRGSRRAGLAKNIWTREPRTQNSQRCCFFSLISNHFACQVENEREADDTFFL